MSEGARDGVAAAVVAAEDPREEAPDGGNGAEDSVAEQNALAAEKLAFLCLVNSTILGKDGQLISQSEVRWPIAHHRFCP